MCSAVETGKPWKRACCAEGSEYEICAGSRGDTCSLTFKDNGPLFYMECPLISEATCGITREEDFPLKIDDKRGMVLSADDKMKPFGFDGMKKMTATGEL